ncbi:ABC transporter permease [Cellulosilyticum sp. ST5]|uniref:ABC transporter permease n=1 Tax=Cellulosilyticum sp. ST5 TaxID=3055805 RepID=UPI0039779CF7
MKKLFQIRKDIPKSLSNTVSIVTFSLLIILWFWGSNFTDISNVFLPTPQATFGAMLDGMKDGSLWTDIGISCYRVFMGFLISVLIGIPIGILAGTFKIVAAVVKPIIGFMRYLPISALIPLIMVWSGVGEKAKVTIIVVGAIFSLITMISDIVRSVPTDLIHSAYTLGATQRQVIAKVIIPAMMPQIVDSLRTVMGWAWTYLVMAEMLASSSGLGYSIMIAERFMKTYIIFMGVFTIGLLGLIIDKLFALINRLLFQWAIEQ